MAFNFILKGLVIGFSIAAPVGPIGVLCIRRSLAEGRQVGLATGLGAATAERRRHTLAHLSLHRRVVCHLLAFFGPFAFSVGLLLLTRL